MTEYFVYFRNGLIADVKVVDGGSVQDAINRFLAGTDYTNEDISHLSFVGEGDIKAPNKKWSCDYPGFESIMDFVGDMHIEDALEAIVPNNEWLGTIRITFEYIPSQEEVVNGKTPSK